MSDLQPRADSKALQRSVRDFYEQYHRHRVRRADQWMQSVYWKEFYGRTLEVGGGTLSPHRHQYFMVDLSIEAARRAVMNEIPALVADGTSLPFIDGAFDTLACYDVLEHVVDASAFLAELCRVAKRRVVIAGPNYVGHYEGGISRYLPLRLWSFMNGTGRKCTAVEDPYMTFDAGWSPDRDAVSAPNAGWVGEQLSKSGFRLRHLRTWEKDHQWLNLFPGIRCLGPFMLVVGEKP